ncbi:MAG TPA: 4'-phosphopantetheinyl transferase superfamily protein [Longimicrobiales bacterium]|nr:4'-phosphopantetheinyl transferase superfamily protein [Longimicrobiales bacterium]
MMHDRPSQPQKRTLRERETHVWTCALDSVPPSVETREPCLSEDERTRSAKFIAPLERRRFILSRIVLRDILAGYQGVDAADVLLAREAGGRPFVEGAERLYFSLSHSGDVAVIAVADVRIGVDVERVRPIARAAEIAHRIMHPETVALLQSLPQAQFERAFLDAWTQREAHVKAVGGGLFRTPDVLPFDPDLPIDASVRSVESREDRSQWSVARFLPYPSTRAAVAAPGALRAVRLMDWNVVHDTTGESSR